METTETGTTVQVTVPGVHPWFAGLAVRDWLVDHGYDCTPRWVRQVGTFDYLVGT
jgi:hypothetical protein